MKSTRAARHRARRFALQALYQRRFVDVPARQIIDEFYEDNDFRRADAAYFGELVEGTVLGTGNAIMLCLDEWFMCCWAAAW